MTYRWILCVVALQACGPSQSGPADGTASTSEGSGTSAAESTDGESSSVSDSTSADDGSEEETTGGNFPGDLDLCAGCLTPCNPWVSGECPTGDKCTAVGSVPGSLTWDANVCVPVLGDQQVGDACELLGSGLDGRDDCADGLMCLGDGPGLATGRCMEFCRGTPQNPSCPVTPAGACIVDPIVPLCVQGCDPLATPPDCPLGQSCIPDSQGGFSCVPGGSAVHGDSCDFPNECSSGTICVNSTAVPSCGGNGCCAQTCDTTQPNTCPGAAQGETCVPYFTPGQAPAGLENLGLCIVV